MKRFIFPALLFPVCAFAQLDPYYDYQANQMRMEHQLQIIQNQQQFDALNRQNQRLLEEEVRRQERQYQRREELRRQQQEIESRVQANQRQYRSQRQRSSSYRDDWEAIGKGLEGIYNGIAGK